MARISIFLAFVSFIFLLNTAICIEDEVKITLISFLAKLSNNNGQNNSSSLVWNPDSDPCKDLWQGVTCDRHNLSVTKLYLDAYNLSGNLDAAMLCNLQPLAASLSILSLVGNKVSGGIAPEIGKCRELTRLLVGGNSLSGNLPTSFAMLVNLKRLDVSNNKFSGELPDLSRISGLNVFLAQNNQLSGRIPEFDFSNLNDFNVSFNNLSGRVPNVSSYFFADSFIGNPQLCGHPLPNNCSAPTGDQNSGQTNVSGPSKGQIIMYSGYAALALVLILFVVFKLCTRNHAEKRIDSVNEVAATNDGIEKPSSGSSESKDRLSKSDFSLTSGSGMGSQSLIVLARPGANELRFDDLLKAPAELLGRGKNGSLYKVMPDNEMIMVVKRVKDLKSSSHEFKQRMQILSQVKHPSVLPPLAFYGSRQEKLLVYEYQENGSLLNLLHGDTKKDFDWISRLGIAATIAQALAVMHQELHEDCIAHGNLKSSNILLKNNMEPCISEYGVMVADDQQTLSSHSSNTVASASDAFKADVYGFGVILLELLTGKLVKSNGMDLTEWVHSVVREEWTGEVFDKSLISECASEERMVNMLQVAIKCLNRSQDARPSMEQVAQMINTIKEEEEKSLVSEALVFSST